MCFVLGMRASRQGEAAPPVWGELLLLQLGIQATRECDLQTHIQVRGYSLQENISQKLKHTTEKLKHSDYSVHELNVVTTQQRSNILKYFLEKRSTSSFQWDRYNHES